jgi:hypothetical protein
MKPSDAVCALHEQSTPVSKLDKNFKNTNKFLSAKGGCIFPEGESPLQAEVMFRTVSKSQGGLL